MPRARTVKQKRPWDADQIADWYGEVMSAGKIRDYHADVYSRLAKLPANTNFVEVYGDINTPEQSYEALRVTVGDLRNGKPNILITAGVHGYEPSGIEASIRFLEEDAPRLSDKFNFLVYPCISPWAYEYDQRWNPSAEDVNRNFSYSLHIASIDECSTFMNSLDRMRSDFACAIDLHETNDKDIRFRQLRADRFATELSPNFEHIPQGAYVILTDSKSDWKNKMNLDFGNAIMNRIADISPIAPDQVIMDVPNNHGVLLAPPADGLTRTFLADQARYVAVTEIYPDHPDMGAEKTVQAQLASIHGAIDYLLAA